MTYNAISDALSKTPPFLQLGGMGNIETSQEGITMRAVAFCALMTLSGIAMAANPITGGFGMKLGQTVSKQDIQQAGAQFYPPDTYLLPAQGPDDPRVGARLNKRRQIFDITGIQNYDLQQECLTDLEALYQRLGRQIGLRLDLGDDQGPLAGIRMDHGSAVWKIVVGPRSITGTCMPLPKAGTALSLEFNDSSLH